MPKRRRSAVSEDATSITASSNIFNELDAEAAAREFAVATPYSYVRLQAPFCQPLLLRVREELGQLQRTFKETDLFKVYQSGDLGNLDPRSAEHTSLLPATLQLRTALYSDRFRAFVRQATGCAPLTSQQDCSCNVYQRGGHLLCHDDVIGTRCVSYILYLGRPGKPWLPRLGGALELYAICPSTGAVLPAPVDAVAPEFGSMVLFTVKPGVSYHSVQEVASNAPRLSVSGWFHAATPPAGADLLAAEERRLALVINPAYLHASTIKQLLSAMSGLPPRTVVSEVRRFRPGLDYTLAHVGTQRAGTTLDATLTFVPSSPSDMALWDSGDVGGFECHVQASAEDAHGAAEVYRARDDEAGVTSIHAASNALSLVVRAPETMTFIKYVSAFAPGSRWDVAAEYTCAEA